MAELIKLELEDDKINTLRDKVLEELRQRELYRPDLIYRGFSSRMIYMVLEHGSENPNSYFIYANPEDHLGIEPDPLWINPLSYAIYGGALVVYRGNKLRKVGYTSYEFLDLTTKPETLVAVFSLYPKAD